MREEGKEGQIVAEGESFEVWECARDEQVFFGGYRIGWWWW